MLKNVIAIIKKEEGILLLHKHNSGLWELPTGSAANSERMSEALKRELNRKFKIDAEIGKLITSFSGAGQETFVYNIKGYDNLVRLFEHDCMEWVPLYKALEYNLTPTTKKVIMYMTKTKEIIKKSATLDDAISCIIERPVLDATTKKYIVNIKNPYIGETCEFPDEMQAMQFYINTVRGILNTIQHQRSK